MRFKTSTLCAVSCLTVLAGFMSVNLAGCGGGGGGGGVSTPTATPALVNATFSVVRSNGLPAVAGTVTVGGVTGNISNGQAQLSSIPAGTYALQVTIRNGSGAIVESYTVNSFIISRDTNQTYFVTNGATGNLAVKGKLFVNPDSNATILCTSSSDPVIAQIGVRVRDLDASKGNPIIGQIIRAPQSSSASNAGEYTIPVPYRPTTFRVEVFQADISSAPFAGRSALNTFTTDKTVVTGVDVCVNSGTVVPVPSATPTLTPTVATPVTPTAAALRFR